MRRPPVVSRAVACSLALALALAARGPASAADDTEWERPFDGVLAIPDSRTSVNPPEDDWEPGTLAVATIVDGLTGKPVPGATLTLFPEYCSTDVLSFTEIVGRATCDARGTAVIDAGDYEGDGHWVADAPGYAPSYEWGERPPSRMLLTRGVAVRGRVLDPRGQPVAGALLDIFPGCSHSGRVREATTGADGGFVLKDVDPDDDLQGCVQSAAGLCEFEEGFGTLGRRPVDIALRTAVRLRGRFVDDEMRGVPGVTVRGTDFRRWPVAVSDADGRWELPVFRRHDEVIFIGPGPDVDHDYTSGDWLRMWSYEHVFRIDRDTAEPMGPDDDAAADLVLRLADGRAAPSMSVLFVRPDDGAEVDVAWTAPEPDDDDATEDGKDGANAPAAAPAAPGPLEPEEIDGLPSGDWEIRPATPFEAGTFEPVRVHVAPFRRTPIEGVVRPQPTLTVTGELPVPCDVTLVVPDWESEKHPQDDFTEWHPNLPATGDAWLRIEPEDHRVAFFVPVGPEKDGVRTAALAVPAPHRLHIRAPSSPDDVTLRCDGFDVTLVRDGGEAWTYAQGPMQLDVEDGDETRRFTFELGAEPQDLVLDWEKGAPVVAAQGVVVTAEDVPGVTFSVQGRGFSIVGGSEASSEPPCRITVTRPGHQPFVGVFTEPATVRHVWGPCSLRVAVRDAEGAAQAAVVAVDGVSHWTSGGVLELRGLTPGAHDVIVDPVAPDLRGVEFRVVLTAPETPGAFRDRTVVVGR